MDTVEELNGTYFYKGYTQLTPQQLWWLINVDALREHLGISVADAVLIASGQPWLPTRQKPGTATPGTSICKHPGKTNHSLLEIFRHTDYVP